MYLVLAALVPFLFLFNPRLALVGLFVTIVWMVVNRTRAPQKPKRQTSEPEYEPGYK
jgi:hypothetical protein